MPGGIGGRAKHVDPDRARRGRMDPADGIGEHAVGQRPTEAADVVLAQHHLDDPLLHALSAAAQRDEPVIAGHLKRLQQPRPAQQQEYRGDGAAAQQPGDRRTAGLPRGEARWNAPPPPFRPKSFHHTHVCTQTRACVL